MRTVIVDTETREILIVDPGLDVAGNVLVPDQPNVATIELSDAEGAKLDTPDARFRLNADGVTIEVEPVDMSTTIDPATLERMAAQSDLATQYQAAMDRLDQIIGASGATDAQRDAAIKDLARHQKRILRYIYTWMT
jgi:hypothetical protein